MAGQLLGLSPRQQRRLRPITFVAAVPVFCYYSAVSSSLAYATVMALIAGIVASAVNMELHSGNLMARLFKGFVSCAIIILVLFLWRGIPPPFGALACVVFWMLL